MNGLSILLVDLLDILKENRRNHRDTFDQAVGAYRAKMIEFLEDQIDRLKNSKGAIRVAVNMPVPEDHTVDYDRAIRMVELAIKAGQTDVELSEYDAAQLVMDDWGWKQAFATTASFYNVSTQ